MENGATRLCASSGTGVAGTLVRQEPCSEYYSHDGTYQEYWATEDLTPGEHLETFHEQSGTAMCLTIRNAALRLRTPLVIEPCGGSIAVGQEFARLQTADGGALLRAYAESGRRVDDPNAFSRYCIGTGGGPGSILRLERCNNRLARQSWFGLFDEGSPGLPGPGPDAS